MQATGLGVAKQPVIAAAHASFFHGEHPSGDIPKTTGPEETDGRVLKKLYPPGLHGIMLGNIVSTSLNRD